MHGLVFRFFPIAVKQAAVMAAQKAVRARWVVEHNPAKSDSLGPYRAKASWVTPSLLFRWWRRRWLFLRRWNSSLDLRRRECMVLGHRARRFVRSLHRLLISAVLTAAVVVRTVGLTVVEAPGCAAAYNPS